MKIGFFLCVTIFSFFYSIAQSETMVFKNITTTMGLSNGDVTSFYQDHEGYIWIGTSDGLNKFDGVGFTIYKSIKNDTASLSTSYINCIYEDKQNNLWIGLSDGLFKYNRDRNNFERIHFIDNHNNKFENSVSQIFEDSSNRLWIGCHLGVYLLNRESKRFTACLQDSLTANTLTDCTRICEDKNKMLWFSFVHSKNLGVIKYNAATGSTTIFSSQNPVYKLKENAINDLIVDNQNNIWIGYYSKGIDVLDQQTNRITNYKNINNNNSLGNNNISSLAQNKDGKIIFGTNGGGMYVFDPNSKLFYLYSASKSAQSLLSNVIQKLYISCEGIVWIGCWGGGVSIYDKRLERFKHYKQNEQNKNSLNGSSVTCFTEDLNGNIWVATDGGGINLFNPKTENFTNYISENKNPRTLTNNKVLAIAYDHHDGLWAGMWQGGLNYFKIEGEKLILKKKYEYVDENDKSSNCIFRIYFDKNNELWIGNFSSGAYRLDPNSGKFKSVKKTNNFTKYNSIRDILCDSYNNVWFATDMLGLIRMNQESGETDYYKHDEKDSTSLIKSSINTIFEDSKKRLWVGGDEDGLNLYNRNTKSFTHYTTEQGLPDNSVLGILEDDHGNLWISSRDGISKATVDSINGKIKLTFRNYTVQDGLQSKVYNRWSYFKSRTGQMYFGGLNGFNTFYPDSVKDNSFLPPVFITDFLLFNKPVIIGAKGSPLEKHISQTKKIVLNHSQSIFTFRFIALNYIFSEKNQYAYKMEGLERDWNYIGDRREATYTNLDPGEYTFRVKASNNDGVWNEVGTSIKITILPPWWKTLWFKIITLFVLLFAIYFAYYLKVANYRKKQKELSELVKKRTAEITKANKELLERQTLIEDQSEELRAHVENLKEANDLLLENQSFIKLQTNKIQEANTELTKLNSTKDRILSIIGHDLRNPFNVVSGFSELLLEDYRTLPPDTIETYLNYISNASKNGNTLLGNLLQWSRIQTGGITFEPIQLNLLLAAKETYNFLEGDAIKKNISIQLQIHPDVYVEADENMLKMILRNLLSNALKFTRENGTVSVSATLSPNQVEICVSDSGVGITEEKIPLLFRIETNTSTKGTSQESGSGLGLILCKEFVERHHGKIWVESQEGIGSHFKFTLPLK